LLDNIESKMKGTVVEVREIAAFILSNFAWFTDEVTCMFC